MTVIPMMSPWSWLCLLFAATVSCTVIAEGGGGGGEERARHNHHYHPHEKKNNPNRLTPSDLVAEATNHDRGLFSCPNCLFDHDLTSSSSTSSRDSREKAETDKLRLEAIKKQILQKLGLKQKPNVTHSLPKEIVWETLYRAEDENGDFFGRFDGEGGGGRGGGGGGGGGGGRGADAGEPDDFYGRTSEIIVFAEEGSRVNQNRLLEFRASGVYQNPEYGGSQVGQEFRVRAATLWLKADLLRQHQQQQQQAQQNHRHTKCRTDVFVFKIISSRLPESVTLSSRQFDRVTSDPVSIPLEESRSGWQKVDLTETVRSWFQQGSGDERLRLFVDCSCCSNWHIHLFNNQVAGRNGSTKKVNPNRPFLVIYTEPNTARRVRRRAIDCTDEAGNQCCKQRFYVSFQKLGWDDWVIAPQGYYANYCRGDCGHHRTPDTYVTYHTHVIEEVRKTHHLSGMTPCCAPLKFSSMSLIYYGPDSTIIKRDLPKMVVDECGCP